MKVEIELDDLYELKEHISSLESELANQTYMGNSISYIYDKMTIYKNQVGKLGNFVREGVREGYITVKPENEFAVEIAKMCGAIKV